MEQQTHRAESESKAVLTDGTLTFCVRKADGTERDVSVDLLVLKLTCEETEQAHQLVPSGGRIQPTAAFLADLAQRLQQLGFDGCTPTLAWQVWVAAGDQMAQLGNFFSGMPS